MSAVVRIPRLIDADWGRFDPWRVLPVRHRLADHPMLQPNRLIEFGHRHERRGRVRSHSNDAGAGTSFTDAPTLHPNPRNAAATLAYIEQAQAWMSLLNVQTDTEYRLLVDEVLDDLRPAIERKDPGLSYRGGWIFVTSPRTVTPYHMDHEHNFILQIRGRKTLYVWEPDDTVAISELARDLFHAHGSRALVSWREELRQRAHRFELEPGMGAYMPSTAPHLVENGDGASITASFTYYTDATRYRATLHALHQRLRERGWAPGPVGARPLLDRAAYALFRSVSGTKQALRRAVGQPTRSNRAAYAYGGAD